jgi:hypothetical protein
MTPGFGWGRLGSLAFVIAGIVRVLGEFRDASEIQVAGALVEKKLAR